MLRVDRQLQADERRAQGETRKYHVYCNHLGTPEALIAQDGLELVWQIELDPWGQTQREYNPNNMLQPIRMQGQQLDAETGLFYNRYRYYDPAGGRYVTQDPIGLAGGMNLYGYVGCDPLFYVDPLGLGPWEWAKNAYDWFDKFNTAKETIEMVDTNKRIRDDFKKARELEVKVLTCLNAQPQVPPGCESMAKLEKDLKEAQELNQKAIKDLQKHAVDLYQKVPGTLGSGPIFIPKP
jgi:RHS repeat-associated protein